MKTRALALTCVVAFQIATAASASATGDATTEALTSAARTYLDLRAEVATGDAGNLSAVPMTQEMAARVDEDVATVEQRIDLLAAAGEQYTYADTTVTVESVESSGDQAKAKVSEVTRLGYASVTGEEPEFTAYQIDHQLTFARSQAGEWLLAADVVPQGMLPITMVDRSSGAGVGDVFDVDDAYPSATVQATSANDCGITSGCDSTDALSGASKFAPSLITEEATMAASPAVPKLENLTATSTDSSTDATYYRYSAMISYAERYWDVYNTNYRTFSNDCTNFISQALRAGGWDFDYGWYRSSSNWWYNSLNQTWTWAGAENWSRFAPKRTAYLDNVWKLVPSDMLQMDFGQDGNMNHSMVVTKRTSSMIYLTYHTSDHLNRSLRSIIASYPGSSNWYYAYRT